MLNFDPTIKLGDVLTIASFLGLAIGAFYNIKGTLNILNLRLTSVEDNVKTTQASVTAIAVQDQRLTNMEKDISDLRHGRGFVMNELNGEYGNRGKRL